MAELKTKKTDLSVASFLEAMVDEARKAESKTLIKLMKKATKAEPKIWGQGIIGFGDLHYVYASGREGDWFRCGFVARPTKITLYFMSGIDQQVKIRERLGKHKVGKGCVYINSLKEVDVKVLDELIVASLASLTKWESSRKEEIKRKKEEGRSR